MRLFFLFLFFFISNHVIAQTYGCTDPEANNYNPNATHNDGSCTYNTLSVNTNKIWILPSYLNETSGLIFWNGYFYSHNDDTDNNLYQISLTDSILINAINLKSLKNIEWEEISQDSQFIYLGDFGNNYRGNRKDLKIIRIDKKSLLENNPLIDTIYFSYSLQTDFSPQESNKTDFDCEAFIVSKDSIYLFTKEWTSQKTSIYSFPKIPGSYSAVFRGSYNIEGLVTGATFLEKEKLIVLTAYTPILQPYLLLLYDYQGNEFFSGNKREIIISSSFHQIEGITTTNGIDYYVSNEKFQKSIISIDPKIQRIDLKKYLEKYLFPDLVNIRERNNSLIKVYPNPTNDKIIIELDSSLIGEELKLVDLKGNELFKNKLNNQYFELSINNLSAGSYMIIVRNPNFFVQKIIKY